MKITLPYILIFTFQAHFGFSQTDTNKIVIGQKFPVTSAILDYDPVVFVSLPAGYSDTIRYPLVLLHDADWLFPAFAGLTRLMGQMEEIPPCIVVGIPLHSDYAEYAPPITGVPESGNAVKILKFYSEELFPFIDSMFPSSQERIIWAHSGLAGLFCTYILLGDCRLFSGIISSSPNLKWVQEYIKGDDVFNVLSTKGEIFYYLSFGEDEEDIYQGDMYRFIREFRDKLDQNAPGNLRWFYRLNEHNNHFTNAVESYVDGLKLYFDGEPMHIPEQK